ncbi:MAG: Ldh family oxidoreductase [Spirochaetaceae bacterium]|nr:MAG: Ldh family oxidoreductase [Spirochaetaceae bacterium]
MSTEKPGYDRTEPQTARFRPDALATFSTMCLAALGVSAADAQVVTDNLVYAELRGHASHGIVRLPVHAKRLVAGVVDPAGRPETATATMAVGVVDGKNALGPVAGTYAVDRAIEAAERYGVGVFVARNSNHFGPAAFYSEIASERGLIGVAASNAPPNMAPWGGKDRFLGTNPFSVAVPAGRLGSIVLDMASSLVARGKIILAAQKGDPIPVGWALDPEGNPTTDAAQALLGAVLPFGGPKGSAISLLIDVFSGVLSGAAYGRHLNTLENVSAIQNLGHFFIVLRIDAFIAEDEFRERVDDLIEQLKASPKAPGVDEILAPGEIERRRVAESKRSGIAVTGDVLAQLVDLAESLGVEPPRPIE